MENTIIYRLDECVLLLFISIQIFNAQYMKDVITTLLNTIIYHRALGPIKI